jgi:hypothetical protein
MLLRHRGADGADLNTQDAGRFAGEASHRLPGGDLLYGV